MADYLATFAKDPDAVLPYGLDWSLWLDGDTIASSSWVASGCTVDSDSNTTTTATAVVSGGVVGTFARITNRITTAAGYIDDRTIRLLITER